MHAEVFRIKVSWRLQLALMVQLPSTHTYTHGVSLGTLISRCQDGIRYIGDSSGGGGKYLRRIREKGGKWERAFRPQDRLTPVKERGKDGGLGRKSLRL